MTKLVINIVTRHVINIITRLVICFMLLVVGRAQRCRTADTHALLDEFQALYSIVTYLVTKIVIYYNLVLCL